MMESELASGQLLHSPALILYPRLTSRHSGVEIGTEWQPPEHLDGRGESESGDCSTISIEIVTLLSFSSRL